MHTPTIDYMEPVYEDFKNLIYFLKMYYNNDFNMLDSILDELRRVHKNLWIMIIWQKELAKKEGINDKYLNDIISNLLSIILRMSIQN